MRNDYKRKHPEYENLARIMVEIQKADEAKSYEVRNKLIYALLGLAAADGLPCGVRQDPQEPKWPVVYIELPTGQVSWHVPQHSKEWDQHTKDEKYERVAAFCQRYL